MSRIVDHHLGLKNVLVTLVRMTLASDVVRNIIEPEAISCVLF